MIALTIMSSVAASLFVALYRQMVLTERAEARADNAEAILASMTATRAAMAMIQDAPSTSSAATILADLRARMALKGGEE